MGRSIPLVSFAVQISADFTCKLGCEAYRVGWRRSAQARSERLIARDIRPADDAEVCLTNWLRLLRHVHPRALRFVVWFRFINSLQKEKSARTWWRAKGC